MVYGNLPPQAMSMKEKGLDERMNKAFGGERQKGEPQSVEVRVMKHTKGHMVYRPGGAYFAMKSRKGKSHSTLHVTTRKFSSIS